MGDGAAVRIGRAANGFTLLEVAVIVSVMTAIIAMVAPTLAGMVAVDNERATRAQLETVYKAIFGDPATGDFGYVGDMGRLPTSLTELVEQGSQTAFHTQDGSVAHVGGIGTGWRGPYLRASFTTGDLLRDAWGQSLTFSNGQVTSGGPDGNVSTTGDNIVFPVHAPASTGTAFISVLLNRIPDPLGATVKLYLNVNGEQVAQPTKKHLDTDPNFDGFWLENVIQGVHVARIQHTAATGSNVCVTVTRYVPLSVYAGHQAVRDIRMLTSADVKVTDNPCAIPD